MSPWHQVSLHRHSHRPPGQCRRVGTAHRDAGTRRKPNKRRNSTPERENALKCRAKQFPNDFSVSANLMFVVKFCSDDKRKGQFCSKAFIEILSLEIKLTKRTLQSFHEAIGATWSRVMSLDNSMFHKALTSQLVPLVQFLCHIFFSGALFSCASSPPTLINLHPLLANCSFFFLVCFSKSVSHSSDRPLPPPPRHHLPLLNSTYIM